MTKNILEEFIRNDHWIQDALNALDGVRPIFPPSSEGYEHFIGGVPSSTHLSLDNSVGEDFLPPLISYSEAFDHISDGFKRQFPRQLFLEEHIVFNSGNDNPIMSGLLVEAAMFLEWGDFPPNEFSNEFYLLHGLKRGKIKPVKFQLSVCPYYSPDQRYLMIEVDLRQAKLPGSDMKELFEKVILVVNYYGDSRNCLGIFYTSNNPFGSNIPTPYLVGIDISQINCELRLCRPVTKIEQFGQIIRRSSDRPNNRHYTTMALKRSRKVLSLANGTDPSGIYE